MRLVNTLGKISVRHSLILVAVGVGLVIAFINIDTTPRQKRSILQSTPVSKHTVVDSELIQFYPNGNGKPIRGSTELEIQMPGNGRSLTIRLEAIDIDKHDPPSVRVILVRNPEGRDQIISLKTDWLLHFPEKALISEVDGEGNRGLFIPVEAGMRFVRYLVLRWDPAIEKFVPLQRAADVSRIEIDGKRTRTATLINPMFEDDAQLYESNAMGFGPLFFRCSKVTKDGYQTIFEGVFNRDIKTDVAGDWQLEISEPKVKTGRSLQTRMVKTTVLSSDEIGFDSFGWNCSDWLEKLQSLRSAIGREASAKRPAAPKARGA